MTIEGDSREYDILASWAEKTAKDFSKKKEEIMLTAEIGVRKGLATKLIMNYIRPNYSGLHFHVGIDPYGDMIYRHYDKSKPTKMDYDEKMFAEVKKDFAEEPRFNLLNMPDDIFFEKYYYGVEFFYESKQYVLNRYALVHFDGPHKTTDVLTETIFFARRAAPGAVFIYDDWKTYNITVIKDAAKEFGFEFMSNGERKTILQKTSET
jgi:hypothetical protein|tara:strand:+ start:370 stop:993 length:624 start_codon:yes stop_codon:yes gene_type:complete